MYAYVCVCKTQSIGDIDSDKEMVLIALGVSMLFINHEHKCVFHSIIDTTTLSLSSDLSLSLSLMGLCLCER